MNNSFLIEVFFFIVFVASAIYSFLLKEIYPIFLYFLVRVYILVFFQKDSIFSLFSSDEKKELELEKSNITFEDIGGLQEAKEELLNVASLFRDPDYLSGNFELPKGIIFYGPPGNGKTILAVAFSNQVNLPFFYQSNFGNLLSPLVGVAEWKIKNFFAKVRKAAEEKGGAVLFFDEIDSFSTAARESNTTSGAINQLLTEIDGFYQLKNVFIIGSTNKIDSIDKAILRAGRFGDLKIHITNPNFNARLEIIKILPANKKFHQEVEFEVFAKMTENFSAAEIKRTVNDALILAKRNGRLVINNWSINEAIDRLISGPLLRTDHFSSETQRRVAIHEAGHAITALSLPFGEVLKVTISPRSRMSGYALVSFSSKELRDDHSSMTKQQILSHIKSSLGGRIAERIFYGAEEISSGYWGDLSNINKFLDYLVIDFEMSSLPSFRIKRPSFWSKDNFSDGYLRRIEEEKEKILIECRQEVKKILESKKDVIRILADILLEKKTIYKGDILYIFFNKISPFTKLLDPEEKKI